MANREKNDDDDDDEEFRKRNKITNIIVMHTRLQRKWSTQVRDLLMRLGKPTKRNAHAADLRYLIQNKHKQNKL